MEYGRVIKRALEITWRHKVLWVFGVAAALFGGTSGGAGGGGGGGAQPMQYTFSGDEFERWRRGIPFMPGMPFGPRGWPGAGYIPWNQIMPVVLAVVGVLFVVGLVFLVLGILVRNTSYGALIGMVDEIEQSDRTTFRSGLRLGWGRFLRLFAINLVMGIVTAALVLVLIVVTVVGALLVAAPLIWLGNSGSGAVAPAIIIGVGAGLVLLLLFILVAIGLSALFTLVREYTYRACVLEKRGVFDAFGVGIALMRGRLRESALMWLLLVAVNLVVGLASIPVALLGLGSAVAPALAVWGATDSVWAAIAAAIPFLTILILLAVFVGGVYFVFRSAVWTLTFRELRGSVLLTEPAA